MRLIPLILLSLFFTNCSKQLDPTVPVINENLIVIDSADETKSENGLKIKWFGTTIYEITLDDTTIVTDPFVTYKNLNQLKGIGSNNMDSDPVIVSSTISAIENSPKAIFIGHSHYDHMLDTVAALNFNNHKWQDTKVYGSKTLKHILAGYRNEFQFEIVDCEDHNEILSSNINKKWQLKWCKFDKQSENWKVIVPGKLSYKSYEVNHAPQLGKFNLWTGNHDKDLDEPPRHVSQFLGGETYFYLFKLENEGKSITIGLAGAATGFKDTEIEFQKEKLREEKVDILILCVPSWEKIPNYPKNFIELLEPKIIIPSHYDDFFHLNYLHPDRDNGPVRIVPTSKLNEFLYITQEIVDEINYDRFEKILLPGVGSEFYINLADN